MFRARRGGRVPTGGTLDNFLHAVEPEGGILEPALARRERAGRLQVLNAEFELRIRMYFHFHGSDFRVPPVPSCVTWLKTV